VTERTTAPAGTGAPALNPQDPPGSRGLVPAGVPEAPAVSLVRSLEGMRDRNRAALVRLSSEVNERRRLIAAREELDVELSMHIDHLRSRL
jgi:hypothetical protein